MDPTAYSGQSVQQLLQELYGVLNDIQLVNYFQLVAVVALVYDYFITMGMEIEYIWPARWNLLKILYLLQRYLPFVDTGFMALYRTFALNPTSDYCSLNYTISGWILTSSITLSEIILTYRVWAVWGRGKWLAIFLPVFFLMCWVPTLYLTHDLFSSITFGPPPVPIRGCFVTGGHMVSYIEWLILLGYETVLMLMMVYSAATIERSKEKSTSRTLAGLVHRDGIVYFIYLFVLSVANVLVILLLPVTVGQILSSLERVVYSLLTSRVVLHIREFADTQQNGGLSEVDTKLTIEYHVERKTHTDDIDMTLRYSPSPAISTNAMTDEILSVTDRGSYAFVVYGEAV